LEEFDVLSEVLEARPSLPSEQIAGKEEKGEGGGRFYGHSSSRGRGKSLGLPSASFPMLKGSFPSVSVRRRRGGGGEYV